jgi:hypothetical protein
MMRERIRQCAPRLAWAALIIAASATITACSGSSQLSRSDRWVAHDGLSVAERGRQHPDAVRGKHVAVRRARSDAPGHHLGAPTAIPMH